MIAAGITCNTQSQIMTNPTLGMKRRLGSVFEFRCKSKCNGSFSFFHYNHTAEKFDLIFQSSNDTYNVALLSFDDGGEYCCSEQCDNKSTTPNFPADCCTRIKSKLENLVFYMHVIYVQFRLWWNGLCQKLLAFMDPLSMAAAVSLLTPGQ